MCKGASENSNSFNAHSELFGVLSLPLEVEGLGSLVARRANVAMISAMCHPPSDVLHENGQFSDECKRLGIREQSWYTNFQTSSITATEASQDEFFNLANLAVAANLQDRNKLDKDSLICFLVPVPLPLTGPLMGRTARTCRCHRSTIG